MSYLVRKMEKDFRRNDFRGRQRVLIACAAVELVGFMLTGYGFFAALTVFVLTAAAQEAERFRRAGTYMQTVTTIYRGSTAHDARHRYLLRGWEPGFSSYPENVVDRPDLAAANERGRRRKPA